LGKRLIAIVIGNEESEARLFEAKPEEDWYRYLFKWMAEAATLQAFRRNNVRFVTFNYDRSLEYFFYHALKSYGKNPVEAAEALRELRIVHVHGKLGDLQFPGEPARAEHRPYSQPGRRELDYAVDGIRIVHEDGDVQAIDTARSWIAESESCIFLGFGFDSRNMQRLSLHDYVDAGRTKFWGTTLGLEDSEVRHQVLRWFPRTVETRWKPVNCKQFLRTHLNLLFRDRRNAFDFSS
jgi:hypothetical protein